jgi:hypothetical protein
MTMNHRTRLLALAVLTSAGLMLGCGSEASPEAQPSAAERCETFISKMAVCQPDLANEARCTEDTLKQMEDLGLAEKECGEVQKAGKADWFSFGGCDSGEHICGWLFCCDDYVITWSPTSDDDWDIIAVIEEMQSNAPAKAKEEIESATRSELRNQVSVTFTQKVAEYVGRPALDMAVHISKGLVEVPYDLFQQRLPAQEWGIELDHYLGGEVKIYETDEQGRAVRQLERMVLSPFPVVDIENKLTNNDMTKVEVIEYAEDHATVFWRVMYSNNNSTETDVGSVDFRAYNDSSTLVTFHSAHRLNAPGGIHVPNDLLRIALKMTFGDFIAHYRKLVEGK